MQQKQMQARDIVNNINRGMLDSINPRPPPAHRLVFQMSTAINNNTHNKHITTPCPGKSGPLNKML